MAKYGSSSFAVLLISGYDLLAAKVKGVTYRFESLMERSDGLGDSWEASTPTGKMRATLTQTGAFFDDTTNSSHDALKTAPTVQGPPRLVVFAHAGNAIGQPFVGIEGTYVQAYDVVATDGQLTKANATYTVSGKLDRGVIVQQWTAKTVDWNTKTDGFSVDYSLNAAQTVIPITSNTAANPSVVTTPVPHGLTTGDIILISGVATSSPTINGQRTVTVISPTTFSVTVNVVTPGTGGSFVRANSSAGGAGYLEVSAFSGFTGFVGKLRSSPDDTTYADLITFSNVTAAPAAERLTVAGVVDRYLSFNGDVTGSGSITVFSGFARN